MIRFLERLLRAALLQADLYEEVEADAGANRQALVVVVLAGAALGVGGIANSGPQGIFWQALVAVIGWWIWAYATYFIGTKLLPTAATEADPGQLLRTIGFSGAPGILRIAMIVPVLAFPAFVVGTLWELLAMVVAVRQALDYTSTLRAVVVCALGWTLAVTIALVLGFFLGPTVS